MICPAQGKQLPRGPWGWAPPRGVCKQVTLGLDANCCGQPSSQEPPWLERPAHFQPAAWEGGEWRGATGPDANCCPPWDLPHTERFQRKTHPPSHHSFGLDRETDGYWVRQGQEGELAGGTGPGTGQPRGCPGQQVRCSVPSPTRSEQTVVG